MSKASRAEQAGKQLAKSIDEMSQLMYQKNTRKNFYKGLLLKLQIYFGQEQRK